MNDFPTLNDVHACIGKLVDAGHGDLRIQIIVVPDATVQALMRASGNYDQAALMVELMDGDPAHQSVCLISYSRALKQ